MISEGAFVEKALSELIGDLTTKNPYGDGGASERIVKTLEEALARYPITINMGYFLECLI